MGQFIIDKAKKELLFPWPPINPDNPEVQINETLLYCNFNKTKLYRKNNMIVNTLYYDELI